MPRTIEVFADVCCPFTHAGLRRIVSERRRRDAGDVRLLVRAWPLELVNGKPLDPDYIEEEADALRDQVAPGLFTHFEKERFPRSSMPAFAVAAGAYDAGVETGEAVSLDLRDMLFEQGRDIGEASVLGEVAARHGVTAASEEAVLADYEEGRRRGVIGSPHFFLDAAHGFFCPVLDIQRVGGELHIRRDEAGFEAFMEAAFAG